MKLTVLLLTVTCLQLRASTYAQQITLKEKNASLEKVFNEIYKQTGYQFVYTDNLLQQAKKIDIDIVKAPLEKVLETCFKDQPFTYMLKDKAIIVKRKAPPEKVLISAPVPVKVTGVVKDKLGNPLIGVTIRVLKKETGTLTNENGVFSLLVEPADSLEISYVGYQRQVVVANSQAPMQITLEASPGGLNEVVVVAYGQQKKSSVTGAIASIQTKEIKQSPAANLAVTLAGRLPGLTVIQSSGEPGRDATALYLRGRGTLNGQNPVILVDGVERDLSYIDPNEVESVTILKDASSTAMFGVRGANGVILVTTRRGETGKSRISLTAETGIQDFTRRNSILNSYDWARLKNEAWHNDHPEADPSNPTSQPPYSDYALEHYRLQDDPLRYPSNNWRDMLMYKFVPQTRYNLSISGGGEKVQYFVNVGYLNQAGQWKVDQEDYDPSSYLKRYNFRSNIDAVLNKAKTLKTFLNVAGYLEKANSPYQKDIFRYINNQFPSILPGPLTPDGEVVIGSGLYTNSPYAMINRSGYIQGTNNNITASWGLQQNLDFFTEGLSAKFMASFDTKTAYQLAANRDYEIWTQIMDPSLKGADGADSVYYSKIGGTNSPLSLASGASFESFTNFQFLVNYNRTFSNKHTVTGLLMAQQEQRIKPGDALPFNLRGFSSRLTYGFKDLYYAEFNAGYNGSEQFAKGQRYGFFPSISGAWIISNEKFMQHVAVLDFLKLRASYGKVGNDRLGGKRFLYLDDIQRSGGGYSPSLGRGGTINESYIGNRGIQWEIAKKSNIGLEVGLFNQLKLSVDVFNESRNNVLISRGSVPLLNGVSQAARPPANIGIVKNQGYEIELNYNKIITNDLTIFSNLNFNYARNEVVFVDEPEKAADYAARYSQTGYMIGQNFGYITDGYFKDNQDIAAYPAYNIGRTPRPGDLKYKDVNGDGIINEKDLTKIGNSAVPQYTYGAAFGINYKGFSISALFQGVAKVSKFLTDIGVYETYDFRERMLDAWTPERAATNATIRYPALSTGLSASNLNNTFYLENTSFVRLKNAEIGYTLPQNISGKIGAQIIRIYVNGVNLFTWDKMHTADYDPEISNSFTYPVYRVFNSGINITF
ncbi:TonB-dependent receptor [Chitinophaga sp. MM2321]|uniref:SusC/RagA family TonB-linked outer membrane protein n=1 Tax=Chitinophaga sp. MM2321 TaxID=3137178 RepID=UPI0032D569B0